MGSRYLTELADWCREAGLVVHEEDGWQERARSSGGFDGDRPWCIMWHHTASNSSPQDDVNYMCHGSPDRPLANILLDRNGEVWIMAAGATNTNGKGYALWFTKGTVPDNSMNTHALGVEACNGGTGEPWPQVQVDAYFLLSNTLTFHLDLAPTDLASHQVYAPDRKIDPATAAAVQGPWKPRSTTSSGTWEVDDMRAEAEARSVDVIPPPDPGPEPPTPPPFTPGVPAPPPTKDDDNMIVALDQNGTAWIGDGVTRFAPSEEVFNNYVILGKAGCYRFVNTSGQVVSGWPNVATVGQATIEALGAYSG